MTRRGKTGSNSYGLIDSLSYTLNGNQLKAVSDAATASAYNGAVEFVDGATAATEYSYDKNDNLTKDLNRNITDISYNCLNLPSQIVFGDGSTITYTYAADGTKLRTVHRMGDETTTTDYCGNVIYENGIRQRLLTEEGYVDLTADTPVYHYFHKDHLDNVRVVEKLTTDTNFNPVERNDYYAFGGLINDISASSVQPYKYNGKELETAGGLNWYDYGARMYDPALGRFTTMDPMAEKYYSISPYAYCGNNPVKRIDPDGKDWYDAVMGYVIGHVTNSIPGTGALRDAYTPTDASDYNAALRGIDNVTIAVGAVMADWGGKGTATGLALAAASGSVLLSTGGASIEVAGPAAVAGLQVAGGSAVVGAAGLYMAANAASNQSGGYERGGNSSGRSGKIIVKKGDVSVSSYGTGDVHKPAHAHVKGGGKEVRIGLKGHPLKGEPDLSKRQKEVVKEHQKEIRKEINKVGRLNKRLENENR